MTSPPRPAARALVFYGVAAYLVLGPAYRQVLGGDDERVRNWVMFSNRFEVCSAQYESWTSDGRREPLDRYAVMGYVAPVEAPTSFDLIETETEVLSIGRALCRKLGGAVDVRVWARCARVHGTGWTRVQRAEQNLCLPASPGRKP